MKVYWTFKQNIKTTNEDKLAYVVLLRINASFWFKLSKNMQVGAVADIYLFSIIVYK